MSAISMNTWRQSLAKGGVSWSPLTAPPDHLSVCPQTSQATCLSVTDELIFCGCADGTVRAFSPVNLHFLCTLPRPHCLGADIAGMVDARY